MKKYIWILIGLISLALIGLIVVQSFWIRNAIELKEEQFHQLITHGLSNIVGDMQQYEAVNYIIDEISSTGDNAKRNNPGTNRGIENTSPRINRGDDYYYFSQSTQQWYSSGITVRTDSLGNNPKIEGSWHESYVQSHGIISGQHFRAEFRKKINNKANLLEQVINRMMMPEVSLEERVNPNLLSELIEKELTNSGVYLDYAFAVKDDNNRVIYRSDNYQDDAQEHRYEARLFPDDIYADPGFLSIYFPTQKNFILKSLGVMGISSATLTLVIILTFILTLYVVFRQKRLSEIKNDFVNNMTHELKTPISTISLASQMLNDTSIPNESKNIIHLSSVIDNESKRLGAQVEKVLQVSIFDKGRLNLKMKSFDLHELLEGIISNFQIQVKKRNGSILFEPFAENAMVLIDEVHFTNVIVNLLENSIKYCNVEPEIAIFTKNKRNRLIIGIKDNGIGISKENQKRIFEKFYRIPTGNVHNVKGFGLGLSYVKKIVEEHNGVITLDSELNKGTTFFINIPFYNET